MHLIVTKLLITLHDYAACIRTCGVWPLFSYRHIKATSKNFMVLVIIGFTSTYFSSIADGLYLSSKYYHISRSVSNSMCIVSCKSGCKSDCMLASHQSQHILSLRAQATQSLYSLAVCKYVNLYHFYS